MRRLVASVASVALIALLVGASTAAAAAPRIVILSGGPLQRQIVVSDWRAISTVTQATVSARAAAPEQAARRPWIRVSMFWGPGWNDYLRQGKDPRALRPGQSDQTGRFYPAYRGRPALMDLAWAGHWPRHVPPAALSLLKRFGVPVVVA